MIKFYFSGAPNPMKVALFLEEAGISYEPIPIDTRKGDQHTPAFKAINPNSKVGVSVDGIVESDAPLQMRYEPQHPKADENGYVYYPNVNVVEEMTNMISASRSFQVNVDVMNAAKQMVQRVLTLGQ